MSAELARHLLQTGAIAPEEVHAALLDVVTLGVPFVQALVSRGSQVGEQLEAELSRLRVPTLTSVKVAKELARRLPPGMCARLLAVPVGGASTGEIEVACVDPLDPAVGSEFSHQLGAPVRIVRASLAQVLLAIERWLDHGHAVVSSVPETADFPYGPTASLMGGLDFALGRALRGAGDADLDLSADAPADSSRAPVFPLVRRPPALESATRPGLGEDLASVVDAPPASAPPRAPDRPASVPPPRTPPPDPALLDTASKPDDVVRLLAELAEPLGRRALVVALRGGVHEVRACQPELGSDLSELRIAAAPFCVPSVAATEGHYLGAWPDDELHAALRGLLEGEVYAVPVRVSGKPTLTLLIGGVVGSLEATRRADDLALRAAAALERIVRERKRGG